MHRMPGWLIGGVLCSALSVTAVMAQDQAKMSDTQQQAVLRIARDVRKQLVTLPLYGVFDNLHFAIQGSTLILRGQASRPALKSDAERAVKNIEGVSTVKNEIEVLPTSPNDDRIRAAVYRSIYGFATLQKYTSNRAGPRAPSVARMAGGITADPPIGWHAIHIIVKNGNVTLTGVVDSEADLATAGMRANMVSGVFSVENDLEVPGQSAAK